MSYIPHTDEQREEMLRTCGVESISELFHDIPAELAPESFNIPEGKSEIEVLSYFEMLAEQNYSHLTNFVGGGFYDHFIPSAVDALVGRSEFYTAYTPYQPEVSQGTLQAIYEYQTDICRLTDMDLANASLYDGGTALYEACQMALRATGRERVILDGGVNPVYRKILTSYTANLDIQFTISPVSHGHSDRDKIFDAIDTDTAAVILQNPSFFGIIEDHSDIVQHCHDNGVLVIQSVYPTAMAMLKTPGEIGVDIAVGEGQSLGIPLAFGGPYLGFMATTKKLARRMPGRVVGRTVDRDGREAFVLTLQAREQHIRREKATSNICTNQGLCALRAHIYLSLLGKQGLLDVAQLCIDKAAYARERLDMIPGVEVMKASPTFNEFTVSLPMDAGEVVGAMVEKGFAPGLPLGRFYPGMENFLLVAVTEKRTKHEIGMLAETLEAVLCQ
ncbi:MAG: aminomethyl-transferring glycine dehydrogenase subunit GcvPA [Kiritimatiellia bacterium]|jgi:glycine dehydrogenase subunit 1|nr:aminomethyl-transferring glycine dehydrogenase subunit GcvPA [Kiritimatiellia bacterium]MDP6849144.1 aminomethyl-transferring glycine dehydrogenase subunit GcvPA [Kiritimatiellia bacterium]